MNQLCGAEMLVDNYGLSRVAAMLEWGMFN